MSVRLAHVSDLHLTAPGSDWRWRDWVGKRLFTWLNLRFFGRGRRFAHVERVLTRFAAELEERQYDRVIFSGDATALGFDTEMRRVAEILKVEQIPGLAVPGNHDYCTMGAARSGNFERRFAPWQQGTRINGQVYPFAQQVGHVWLIAVNSAKGSRWCWDATGRIGDDQRDRLRRLLHGLPPGPRILVTHYPICLANGRREGLAHGLKDVRDTVAAAAAGGVGLWLHGHRHRFYCLPQPPGAPFPVICAGSTTQSGLWNYGEYEIEGHRLRGVRRVYDPQSDAFRDADRFELELPGAKPRSECVSGV
ncbi:MAG: metallophosphoesterase [Gemmataceae bacterium]|nr:metallophosphoesterase [Gemmataceae bacterium]